MSDVSLLRTIFKSRTDVFAIRWQKGTKSGYTPAYEFDPYLLRQHKIGGGTMQNFAAKTYLSLTEEQLKKHVDGQQFIGIYPLLSDNTSWWIAADFDENDWIESAGRFIDACRKFHIPAYLERSRSGNGGHVWIFFSQPYPAVRSRKIFIWLLESSGAFSVFDKSASFDRLFPNQDYLSGKGLGNLIALPLHGPSVQAGNCCFIDPKTLIPFADQWAFLASIQHAEVSLLDAIFEKTLSNTTAVPTEKSDLSKLTIRLDNMVHLSRNNLPLPLVNYLKDTFTFANSAFYVKEKSGRSTWNTDRFFKLIDEEKSELRVPRGEISPIIYDYHDQKIDYLHRMFLKRNAYYRTINRQQTLFDEPDPDKEIQETVELVHIREKVKIPLDQFEFQYGAVSFLWTTKHLESPVLLEIENDYLRPEFVVLTPYLSKLLQSKWAEVDISLDVEHGQVVAIFATSPEIDRINREIIETVRFQFAEKYLLGQKQFKPKQQGLLDIDQVQENDKKQGNLYTSGEDLLSDVLTRKEYKHSQHLRFLANQHQGSILKLRFVLSPFAFVFLLKGETNYHVVLETLDTEEATYIWHVAQDKSLLKSALDRINADLQYIRTHGRQHFLASAPPSFTRIQHDYSDMRKGFIAWRDGLEEWLS